MERLDHPRTVADLVALDGSDLAGRVDALVDACLEASGGAPAAAIRNRLADEFLAAAPFTALSYRIWRRILRDDTQLPELPERVPSELLLPDLDFVQPTAR